MKKGRILVVDDDPSLLEGLSLLLTKAGYEALQALDAPTALASLQGAVDLVILDVRLGEHDGLGLLAEIKRSKPVPVLILTGYGSKEVAVRALRGKADEYLEKPFDPLELLSRIERLLGRPLSQAEAAEAFIQAEFRTPLRSREIAKRVGVGERSLRVRFKERFGLSQRQYLERIRMEEAKRLLQESAFSIKEVAQLVGFQDPNYFSKVFRKRYGLPPTALRNAP